MKSNPLQRIRTLIEVLPEKDAKLCTAYLDKRNFQCILEIVESDIYKAKKLNTEELPDDYISSLLELKDELTTYMSYIYTPEDLNDDDYY